MDIKITLTQHCIQTGAKKKYNNLVRRYIANAVPDKKKPMVELQIDALKFFLETVDFKSLRSHYPELSGRDNVSVTLMIPKSHNEIKLVYDNKTISPEWKISACAWI